MPADNLKHSPKQKCVNYIDSFLLKSNHLTDQSHYCTSIKNLPTKELGHMISTMRSTDETVTFHA